MAEPQITSWVFGLCLLGSLAAGFALGWWAASDGYGLTVSDRSVAANLLRFRDEAGCAKAAAEVRRRLGDGAIVRDCFKR